MSIASIIVIAAIIILSIVAVITAQEPLDELFHVDAAMNGFPLQPLATKMLPKQGGHNLKKAVRNVKPEKSASTNAEEDRKSTRLTPQPTASC